MCVCVKHGRKAIAFCSVPGPSDEPGLLQGFKRVPNTKVQTYSHQFFKRGQRELLALMTRGGQKSNSDHLLLANFALKHKVGTVLHLWGTQHLRKGSQLVLEAFRLHSDRQHTATAC